MPASDINAVLVVKKRKKKKKKKKKGDGFAATAYNPAAKWVDNVEEIQPVSKFTLPSLQEDRKAKFDAAKT